MKITKQKLVKLIEEVIQESKMLKVQKIQDYLTIQHYLKNIGLTYGTAYDKQLRHNATLLQAARNSGRKGLPFPEKELWQLLGDLNTADKRIAAAKKAYVNAGGQLPMGE